MGRKLGKQRNRYRNMERLWEQDGRQQQQEKALDDAESELLKRQVYVTKLNGRTGNLQLTIHQVFSKFGTVSLVTMKQQAITQAAAQRPFKVPTAVVEFEQPAAAAAVLAARREVLIHKGKGKAPAPQLVLEVGSIGWLRRQGSYSGAYCMVQPNRPQRSRSYQHGQAGQHGLQLQQLQLGSSGPDGISLICELDLVGCCSMEFDLQRRCLTLTGPVAEQLGDGSAYCLEVAFRHLRHSLRLDQQQHSLTFTIRQPPKVLKQALPMWVGLWALEDAEERWELSLDPTAVRCCSSGGSSIGSGLAGADGLLGRCFSFRLLLSAPSFNVDLSPSSKLFKKLRSFRLLSTNKQQQGPVVSHASWEEQHGPCQLPGLLQRLPFELRVHVMLLLSAGVASIWQVSDERFQQLLMQHCCTPQQCSLLCQALSELAAAAAPVRDCAAAAAELLASLTELQEQAPQQPSEEAAGARSAYRANGLFQVLRAHLTPTRLKVLQLERQTSNRVIRHFCSADAGSRSYSGEVSGLSWLQFSPSHFLRLSFGDEGGDRMFGGNRDEPIDAFWQRMEDGLSQGVTIGGRRFAFLAYSSSQLKSWSCWMVADPRQGQPGAAGAEAVAAALRAWMGDAMKTERVPAKCAARLGQCFSATVDGAELHWQQEVGRIPDVLIAGAGGANYCFSDGVGRISPALLQQVVESLDYVNPATPVSAIQVRFGGCKGVFCRYDGNMSGMQLQYRPSQQKFGSQHPRLEVCSVAGWLPAYLNRQVILMMEHNGLAEQVFIRKQRNLLDSLARMCRSATAALELLPALGGIEPGAQAALLHLLEVCVSCRLPSMGPLLDSCLRAVAGWQVTDLRIKARLLVQQGATLMGVMDEFGLLEEDEVFVQVQPRGSDSSARRIITGPVMLAKHPVAHRGDVRVVAAVDPRTRSSSSSSSSELAQLLVQSCVNVVVFSQKGRRPLPNKLSGSDLDGDLYHVHWDQELLPPDNQQPMDYSAEPPEQVDRITPQHLQQHFVNFARNDRLGMISTWLLAQADRHGAGCGACERLAQLHSMAVDFPKTGRPADMSATEQRELRPVAYPHWMEKPERDSYRSETVLGRLYDAVLAHPAAAELCVGELGGLGSIQSQPAATMSWPKQLLPVGSPGFQTFLEPAGLQFALFEQELVALMNRWQVYDVGQMVTGCLPQLQRQQQRHQQSEQRDQLNRELRGVFGRARAAFLCLLLPQPAIPAGSGGSSVHSSDGIAADTLEALPVKRLQAMVDAKYGNSSSSGSGGGAAPAGQQPSAIDDRHRCAAAFMCVAHKQLVGAAELRRVTNQAAAAEATAEEGSDTDGVDDDSSSDESVYSDEEDQAAGAAKRGSKEWEVQQVVRLCFQFVVARELAQLARWVQ